MREKLAWSHSYSKVKPDLKEKQQFRGEKDIQFLSSHPCVLFMLYIGIKYREFWPKISNDVNWYRFFDLNEAVPVYPKWKFAYYGRRRIVFIS